MFAQIIGIKNIMANIKDVAELADVSITTVSHVINQTRYVSDELTERVKKAMEELDYHPNSLARGLRSGKTKTIGLVIPDISNQFFAEISRKIED
jgi:LacI family transcriptional regulator